MDLTKDFYKFTLFSVLWAILTILTFNGTIQNYIQFQDAINEIAFAYLMLMGFGICAGVALGELRKSFINKN